MAKEYYEPPVRDVVVNLGADMGHHVPLADLERAGIDTGYPFLVWADRIPGTVHARQLPEWREGDPARLFTPDAPLVDADVVSITNNFSVDVDPSRVAEIVEQSARRSARRSAGGL